MLFYRVSFSQVAFFTPFCEHLKMPTDHTSHDEGVLAAFANAIRAERKMRGISQENLAAMAGINRGYMGYIERGQQNPTLLLMLRIASALEISLSQLIRNADL